MTIDNLKAELAAKNDIIADLSAQVDELKKDLAEREYHEAELAVDAAIQEGKISKEVKSIVLAFYLSNPEDTKKLLEALNAAPGTDGVHTVSTLSSMIRGNGTDATNRVSAELSWDELFRQGKLETLKAQNPELFNKKFNEKFGK